MNDKKRLNSYEDLPLVLDVADIQRIMGISRVSAYELVHTPGFPAFRRGRLIKVSKCVLCVIPPYYVLGRNVSHRETHFLLPGIGLSLSILVFSDIIHHI